MSERILILGGGAAGMSAAIAARGVDSSCEIIVVEKGNFVSYANCGIPHYISGTVGDYRELIVHSPEYFEKERNIKVITGVEATEINRTSRQVSFWNRLDSSFMKISYDTVVLATGGRPVLPPVPGVDAGNIFTIRSLDDAIRLKRLLIERRVNKVAVIGGGWIGVLLCEAFSRLGKEVTLIEKENKILPGFDKEISAIVEDRLRREVTDIYKERNVKRFIKDRDGEVSSVDMGDHKIDTQLVILAVGVVPCTELFPREGGVSIIETDERMKTPLEGIFACGDCTTAFHNVINKKVYKPLGTTANKQGAVAGQNAAGRYAFFSGILGTQALTLYELEMARTGLSGEEAKMYGYKIIEVTTTSHSRAEYISGGSPITTKVIVESGTGRILGAQMIGREAVAKRLDVFVPILLNNMTLSRASQLDLSYTPLVAPLWDPVLYSLRKVLRIYESST